LLGLNNLEINDLRGCSFALLLREKSRYPQPLYKSKVSGRSQTTQKFICSWNSKHFHCPSHIAFALIHNKYKITNFNFVHSHQIDPSTLRIRHYLSEDQITEIVQQTHLNVHIGDIRNNVDSSVSADILQNIRRGILKLNRTNEIHEIDEMCRSWDGWNHYIHNTDLIVSQISFVHLRITSMQNPIGIFFMDDSIGTNSDECSLVAIISYDSNAIFKF
jgi:hypothetical protein